MIFTSYELRVLADRIDREMVELPKDAEGEPIHIGDVLYSSGNECRVISITVKADEACVGVHTDEGAFLPSVNPKYLSRKNPETLEPEALDAERALPEGVEWPRFEVGELVKAGDEVEYGGEAMRVCSVTFVANGWSLRCERRGVDGVLYGSFGERVKRPAPKVLDADGVPIKVGDTVYCNGEDKPLMVSHIVDSTKVTLIADRVSYFRANPSRLSHERPDSWRLWGNDLDMAAKVGEVDKVEMMRRAKALAKATAKEGE